MKAETMPLADLPAESTVREAAARLSYEEAIETAASIHADIKAGRLTRPYPYQVRFTLYVCAEVFKGGPGREAIRS